MKVLHVAGGFAQHPLYPQLVHHLRRWCDFQFVFAPVRTAAEKSRQPDDVPSVLEYRYELLLRPHHRVLFRAKIRSILTELLHATDLSRFDIVHAHTLYSDGAVALRLKEKFGTPYVVAVRNTDLNVFMRFRPDLRLLAGTVLREAGAVIFLSPAYRSQLLLRLRKGERIEVDRKSVVIPNGVDSRWLSSGVHQPRAGQAVLRLLYVGDFSRNKNVPGILRAVAQLAASKSVELTLVGGGGDGESGVRDMLRSDEFSFARHVGRVNDRETLLSIYQCHDLFIMPSFKETFGVVYLEALSQGLPIIHSRGQGVDGFFQPGTVSEAVDPKDPMSIAAGIDQLVGRLDKVRSLCIEVARRFDWSTIATQYRDLYRESTTTSSAD